MQYTDLGNTGLNVSRLAVGTGTHGWNHRSDQTALGYDGFTELFRTAYDRGITFWDVADQYGTHSYLARAMQGIPRDSLVITTKTTSSTYEAVTRDVDRFLRELQTDTLDIVLLHCMTSPNWPRERAGAMDGLSRAKEQGKVRAVGVSCHDFGALRAAAASDWVDVVLVRINYAGVNMDANPADVVPVIRQMHSAGKGVYAMKVLGCGKLTQDPRRAIEFVFRLGTVHAMTIGMVSPQQVEQNVQLVEEMATRYPLS